MNWLRALGAAPSTVAAHLRLWAHFLGVCLIYDLQMGSVDAILALMAERADRATPAKDDAKRIVEALRFAGDLYNVPIAVSDPLVRDASTAFRRIAEGQASLDILAGLRDPPGIYVPLPVEVLAAEFGPDGRRWPTASGLTRPEAALLLVMFFAALRCGEMARFTQESWQSLEQLRGAALDVQVLGTKGGNRRVTRVQVPPAAQRLLADLWGDLDPRMAVAPVVHKIEASHRDLIHQLMGRSAVITPHALRKGGATYAVKWGGLSYTDVMSRFGWTSEQVLSRYIQGYNHDADLNLAWIPKY